MIICAHNRNVPIQLNIYLPIYPHFTFNGLQSAAGKSYFCRPSQKLSSHWFPEQQLKGFSNWILWWIGNTELHENKLCGKHKFMIHTYFFSQIIFTNDHFYEFSSVTKEHWQRKEKPIQTAFGKKLKTNIDFVKRGNWKCRNAHSGSLTHSCRTLLLTLLFQIGRPVFAKSNDVALFTLGVFKWEKKESKKEDESSRNVYLN